MIVREFWHINANESEIREKDYCPPGKDELLIQSLYSLVSTGTERLVSLGMVPSEIKSLMKVPYMDGNLGLPVKYGYSLVGLVIEGPGEFIGKAVHLMHPHQDLAIVDAKDVTIIPEEIPLPRATLVSTMETALNTIWDSKISIGDHVLVCGFGIIGALIATLARQIPNVKVTIHEINKQRRNIATSLGFEAVTVADKNFDVAINTSGSGDALQICIDETMHGGTIAEVSWYGNHEVKIQLGNSFHIDQKKIIAPQASSIPLDKYPRYDMNRRKKVVFDLLKSDLYDKLPFDMVAFETLPDIFKQIRYQHYDSFCTMVKYQ